MRRSALPALFVQTCPVIEGDRQQPCIRVDCHERQPILLLQAAGGVRPLGRSAGSRGVARNPGLRAKSGVQEAAYLHPVACKVYAQAGLGHLGRHLLRGQGDLPGAVRVAIQAQVLPLGIAGLIECVHLPVQGAQDAGPAAVKVGCHLLGRPHSVSSSSNRQRSIEGSA